MSSKIQIKSSYGDATTELTPSAIYSSVNVKLPDKSGTLAVQSDIPTDYATKKEVAEKSPLHNPSFIGNVTIGEIVIKPNGEIWSAGRLISNTEGAIWQ